MGISLLLGAACGGAEPCSWGWSVISASSTSACYFLFTRFKTSLIGISEGTAHLDNVRCCSLSEAWARGDTAKRISNRGGGGGGGEGVGGAFKMPTATVSSVKHPADIYLTAGQWTSGQPPPPLESPSLVFPSSSSLSSLSFLSCLH